MILNYPPHSIDVYRREDVIPDTGKGFLPRHGRRPFICIPSSGIARAQSVDAPDGMVDGIIPRETEEYGPVENLPAPRFGVWIIVSKITADAARAHGRTTDDLLLTKGLVRNGNGTVIGCTAVKGA